MAAVESRHAYTIYATSAAKSTVALLHFTPPHQIELITETKVGESPSWMTFYDEKQIAYVLGSNVSAYSLHESSSCHHDTSILPDSAVKGDEFVSGCIVQDCLYLANYIAGTASIWPIKQNPFPYISEPAQVFHYSRQGVGPVTSRQDKSYAHDVTASPEGKWVYVCDLGTDEIHRIDIDESDCSKSTSKSQSTSVAEGSGPRHLSFYKDKDRAEQFAYLSSELSCTLTAFSHNPHTGALTVIGEPLLTVPKGTDLGGTLEEGPVRTTAEVVVSPDGRFVYVSNRGDEVEDHITVFRRDSDGSISYVDWYPSGGLKARHCSLSHDGKYLVVAHETSGTVVVLKRNNHDGSLEKTGASFVHLPGTQFAGFHPSQYLV